MPRRRAADRHLDSTPGPEVSTALDDDGVVHIEPTVDALVAIAHPLRRRLLEVLRLDGPAPVGVLAQRLGVAAGSVSHHARTLHRSGFVEPAPELARDTRESWWRATRVHISWSRHDFPVGTAGRQVAEIAARANIEHHMELIRASVERQDSRAQGWERVGMISDTLVPATIEQVAELAEMLTGATQAWRFRCAADVSSHPEAERQPVLVATYVLPVQP